MPPPSTLPRAAAAHWADTMRQPPATQSALAAPATQIVGDRDAYLGQGRHDVGRRIAEDQVELFVSGDVAAALQQEFVAHASEFIALHDIGTSASLRLLNGLAGAAAAPVQRLSVRRQGQGVPLAVLQFVEVPLADGSAVRVYSTDISADSAARAQLAQALLAYSKLGVLMVGELPPHAMTSALRPLQEALGRGPWPNRDVLLVPLGSGTALAAQAAQLSGHSHLAVHVTPRAAKPKHAWTYIGGAWNRLHGRVGGERALQTDLARAVPRPAVPQSEAATEQMDLREIPSPVSAPPPAPPMHRRARNTAQAPQTAAEGVVPTGTAPLSAASATATRPGANPGSGAMALPTPMPVPGQTRWHDYAARCAAIKGALSACIFDAHSLQALAHAGGLPAGDRLAQHGASLLATIEATARALGLGATRTEAAISTPGHHLLLRPVPGHPGIALHMVLSASAANLTLARMQLERIEVP